jgi:hypothetical protein
LLSFKKIPSQKAIIFFGGDWKKVMLIQMIT